MLSGFWEKKKSQGFDVDKLEQEGRPISSRFTEAMKVRKPGHLKQIEKNQNMALAHQDAGEWRTARGFSKDAGTEHAKKVHDARQFGNTRKAHMATDISQRQKDAMHHAYVSDAQNKDWLKGNRYMQQRYNLQDQLANSILDAKSAIKMAMMNAKNKLELQQLQFQLDYYNMMQGNMIDMAGNMGGMMGGQGGSGGDVFGGLYSPNPLNPEVYLS